MLMASAPIAEHDQDDAGDDAADLEALSTSSSARTSRLISLLRLRLEWTTAVSPSRRDTASGATLGIAPRKSATVRAENY